ncbi:hypothetical protein Nit79A3_3400 [Nitrosomonas sp. Is79A3]
MLPRGLLAHAALYRDTRNPKLDFTRAHQDLQEVYGIAEPNGMRLHLTRLSSGNGAAADCGERESPFFKEGSRESGVPEVPPPLRKRGRGISLQAHVAQAEKLIEETGYKRRLPELQELQKIIREQSFS